MLKPAILYKEELEKAQYLIWNNEKYKYWFGEYNSTINIEDNNFYHSQLVSVDSNNTVLGYISYDIDRTAYYVSSLRIINLSDNIVQFGIDLRSCLEEIFNKYKFNKICFGVYIGNPVEKSYDKLVLKYGGRVVGTYIKHGKIMTGEVCDYKMYEISRESYLSASISKSN